MVLEAAERACAGMLDGTRVRTRLEVGDPRAVVAQVAADEGADVVVMGALGSNGLPYGPELGETAQATWGECTRPILVGSPRGVELLAGEECLLVATRQEVAPIQASRPMESPATESLGLERREVPLRGLRTQPSGVVEQRGVQPGEVLDGGGRDHPASTAVLLLPR
jgi:hypothetical protein